MTVDVLTMHVIKRMLREQLSAEFSDFDMDGIEDGLKAVLSDKMFIVQIHCGISGEDK